MLWKSYAWTSNDMDLCWWYAWHRGPSRTVVHLFPRSWTGLTLRTDPGSSTTLHARDKHDLLSTGVWLSAISIFKIIKFLPLLRPRYRYLPIACTRRRCGHVKVIECSQAIRLSMAVFPQLIFKCSPHLEHPLAIYSRYISRKLNCTLCHRPALWFYFYSSAILVLSNRQVGPWMIESGRLKRLFLVDKESHGKRHYGMCSQCRKTKAGFGTYSRRQIIE